ncbi:CHASE2 domain-containing protein [Curvibacter gracilis]|uniref:CHASE2 domain-containing protein n=1 Tax=Curvibacter gracilis TaxID=230310 RepID=UPI0004AD30CF|nr:adenylate/guanylate cyclase domain-containing protein [Curvibacter gracilis]
MVWPAMAATLSRLLLRHFWRRGATLLPAGVLLAHVFGVLPLSFVSRLDDQIYDVRLRLTMPASLDPRVAIVDIDEKSLAQLGHWPWGRDQLALLADRLFQHYGVAALGFDVLFSESDTSSGLASLQALANGPLQDNQAFRQQLEHLTPSLNFDRRFAQALQGRPVVLGYYFSSDRDGRRKGELPAPVLTAAQVPPQGLQVLDWDGYGASLPELARAAPRAGFFNSVTDEDGVVRSLPLLSRHDGQYYESLALALYRVAHDLQVSGPVWAQAPGRDAPSAVLEALQLQGAAGTERVPLDPSGTALVPFRGRGGPAGGSYRYVSAIDVLEAKAPREDLQGRIVLVGSTSPGLLDLRATPVGQIYPGVESHANLISGLLDRHLLVRPDYAAGYEVLVLVTMGLALAWLLPGLSAVAAMWVSLASLLLVSGLNFALYSAHGLVLPLASALLMVLLAFGVNMSYGYLVESRAKRRLANVFGTYVPPELVDQMLQAPDQYTMRAASRELTVMFCDMRGFTQLSEGLEPEAVQALLNQLFSRLTVCIRRHQGTIDKYIGDCVMAFWGAPVALPNHAALAVQAAQDMVAEVARFNQERQAQGLPCVSIGIGLNTGLMRVGDMGSDLRRSYTVIGDAVNLASRLEGLSRLYGVSVIAGESTRRQAANAALWQALDCVRVKGKGEPVQIHTPHPVPADEASARSLGEELAQWAQFLAEYRAKKWSACSQMLEELRKMKSLVALCQIYGERLVQYQQAPPPDDWDGVTVFDIK